MTIADKLSQYPIAQQVVGTLTIASNAGKIALDLVKSIYNLAILALVDGAKWYHDGNFKNGNEYREKIKFFEDLEDNPLKTNFREHFEYIGIGFQRAVPIWGTFFSIQRCTKIN